MNFLALAQKLHQEAGLSGPGPASVSSQSGMAKNVVDWINDAWYEIQGKRTNWRFMWNSDGLVTTVANQREYDLAALGFDCVPVRDSFRQRQTGSPGSEVWLSFYEYESFRAACLFGVPRTGLPDCVTIDPGENMQVDPVPTVDCEVRFEYYDRPAYMTLNTDVPSLPTRYHDAIWILGLMKYSAYDENTALFQDAQRKYATWINRIEADQLLTPYTGATLA